MKSADRLKFTAVPATDKTASTLTFSAAIAGFRTPAQIISDGVFAVSDTAICLTSDDGAGNKETSLYTLTSANLFTRTEVQSSTAGGTTPVTFTGSTVTVYNGMSAKQASALTSSTTNATSGEIELKGGDGQTLMVVSPNLPINADGRRNGTVWYQSAVVGGAVTQWVKIAGVYQTVASPSVAIQSANPVAPGAPTVTATKGPASATLVIAPGTAGSVATSGYTVTLPSGAADADNGTTKLTRTITGLTPFTSQTFSVVANSTDGNSAAGVSNAVAADRVDTTAPTLVGGTVTGSTVRLTYSEALTSSTIAASQFTMALNGGAAVAASAIAQFGSLLILTFSSTAAVGDTATITYTQGAAANAVRDVWNNLAANFSAQSITNNTAATTTNVFGANRIRPNDAYVTGSSGIATYHYKFEAEADFIGIRVGYIEHNTSGTMPNLEFLYGVTDTGAYDTVAHEYLPTSGGVSKNTMATTATEVAWHRGTWNGGNNIGTPTASAQASYAGNVTWSDLMPCASIPRTDVVGGRPMLVLRVANTLAGAVWTQGPANANYNTARGQTYYREMLSYKTANDGVNTLTNIPSGTNNNFQNEMAIFVEFQYANPIRNVILTGDSRKSAAFNSHSTSWGLEALRQAVGATGRIGVVNCCGSGHNQVQFLKLVNDFLDSGGHATDIIIPAFSQNGYTTASVYASNMQATLDRCATAGINIWMDTDYAVDGYTTQEAQRQISLGNARTLLAQGKIKGLIDIDSLVTDYGPQYPIFNAGLTLDGTSFPGDKIHVSSATQLSLLEPMLMKVWQ